MFSYASKARRELPNDTVFLDGAIEQLGKTGTFLGQHIYTSRRGVAVQINAFNFPVWGMLEKLAPRSSPACRRSSSPPARRRTSPSWWSAGSSSRGLLPEGSLQLLCGSAGGLLDHLGAPGLGGLHRLGRTGGDPARSTPSSLRGAPARVEADSLNCSILGPDVTAERSRSSTCSSRASSPR